MKKIITLVSWIYSLYAFAQTPLNISYPLFNLCLDSNYTITWTGGDPNDSVSLSLIDVDSNATDLVIVTSTLNTGSYQWTCQVGGNGVGVKQFYVQSIQQASWSYGPQFNLSDCFSSGTGNMVVRNSLLKIYPNPASDWVNVELPLSSQGASYTILDPLGRIVASGKCRTTNSAIPITELPTGVYILAIGEQDKLVFKFAKK